MFQDINEKKIAFILYRQEQEDASLCMESLRQIRCPEGYQVEVVTIERGESRGIAYQSGMERSDAKFKIYLDAGTWLLHEKLLEESIALFLKNPNVGIIGVIGTELVPTNGHFWESPKRIGEWSDREGRRHIVGNFTGVFREVQTLDDCFLMTQYDIPWRGDLFGDERFLCAAQAIEFKRRDYKACVIHQSFPWLVCRGQREVFDADACERFLDEYSKDIFPLVSVVIPTYCRPEYFRIALDSVLSQTYRNLDIFITDNSPDDRTENLMRDYLAKDPRIQYEHHRDYDAAGNWWTVRQYNNPKAEYVNWLMDDDVFLPEKIEKMMNCYLFNPGVTLVTSYRQRIDAKGSNLPDAPWTAPIVPETSRLSGKQIGKAILTRMMNFVGEPTTVLVRKSLLKDNYFGWRKDEGRYWLADVPAWLNLLSQGDMVYFREPLSQFRQHSGQQQCDVSTQICVTVCWALEIQYAWQQKIFLETEEELRSTILLWATTALSALRMALNQSAILTATDVADAHVLEKTVADMMTALNSGFQLKFSGIPVHET